MSGSLALAALLLGIPALSGAASQPRVLRAQLATHDTLLVLEAGRSAPRLLRLAGPGVPPWRNEAAEAPPAQLEIAGRTQQLHWQLDATASRIGAREVEFVYRSAPRLTWRWRWRAPLACGPIEHSARFENRTRQLAWLHLQPSLSFAWRVPAAAALERFWVEKGADTPAAQGWLVPRRRVQRSHAPHAAARRDPAAEAGLDPEPYRTRVPAGAAFTTPTVFLGATAGGPDPTGNVLRRWVRAALNRPGTVADPRYPLLVSNSWGAGMAVDEALAQHMIGAAADLGLEMFHLDAGWFRDVGDWEPDPVKFPHGLAALAGYAHQRGMRFGLWMDWTQAGTSAHPGARSVTDPVTRDWLIADPPAHWRHSEPFQGNHLRSRRARRARLGRGGARARHQRIPPRHARARTATWSPRAAGAPTIRRRRRCRAAAACSRTQDSSGSRGRTRPMWPSTRARLPRDPPHAARAPPAPAARGVQRRRTHDRLRQCRARRLLLDHRYLRSALEPPRLPRCEPPAAPGDAGDAAWPAARVENFRYLPRSGMLGWFSLMLDPASLSAAQQSAARAEFALYKRALRPLIRSVDLYHVSARPDGVHWDGIEYVSPDGARGVLYAFRGSGDEGAHHFVLHGLRAGHSYRLHFQDQTAPDSSRSAEALLREGSRSRCPRP